MELRNAIRRFFLDWELACDHLLVAVSGGPDSTALLLALAGMDPAPFRLTAAHVNHRLRGEASQEDEQWLRELCRGREIDLRIAEGPLDPARIREIGVEAAAREQRYLRLQQMRDEAGAAWIATGHQQNDQAETILIRLLTGTGVSRLRGILPVTETHLVRPMLSVSRSEIDRFLEEQGVDPREDQTNLDRRFLRNWVRLELLPMMERRNPRIVPMLARTATEAREQHELVEQFLDTFASCLSPGDNQTIFHLDCIPAHRGLRRAILLREIRRLDPRGRGISRSSIDRVLMELPELRRRTLSRSLEILRSGPRLILRRMLPSGVAFEEPLHGEGAVELPTIEASLRVHRYDGATDSYTDEARSRQLFQLPDEAQPHFLVRSRLPGDRFQPLGLRREKKLKDFLIDRKVPQQERDRLPLLTWNHEIVWVAGVEVSERFKVRDPERAIWEASVSRAET